MYEFHHILHSSFIILTYKTQFSKMKVASESALEQVDLRNGSLSAQQLRNGSLSVQQLRNGSLSVQLDSSSSGKGGFRATIFVYVLACMEAVGFVANTSSLVLYFHLILQFGLSQSANTLTNFMGSVSLLTILGGFISDTYLNRLYTVLLFGVLELSGLLLLTIQAYSKKLQPAPCNKSTCIKGGEEAMFYITIGLYAIGAGGVKGVLPALGADQFITKDLKGATKGIASFFNYYQFSANVGSVVGVTIVVWIAMNKGWYKGFLIGLLCACVGYLVLACGKKFYTFRPLGTSPLTKIARVFVAAIRNRKSRLPQNAEELYEIESKEQDSSDEIIAHTGQFKWLDKAAIHQGTETGPWNLCTITQVEQVKILIRMLPIIISTIILNTCMAQTQTFSVLQGYTMNPYLGSFKVPAASIPVIPLIFMVLVLPVYEFFFVPFARKITGHPAGITQLQRVGVGLVLSFISMGIAGAVEVKRRDQAIKDPHKPISLFWLSFQYGIVGSAEMFSMVGLMEFYYREAPEGMKSLATSFAPLSLSFGYFLSTIFVNVVNAISKKRTSSKLGWLESPDLNQNKLNYFYWFLAILSFLNFVNYLFWASWYTYRKPDVVVLDKGEAQTENTSNGLN